MFTLRRIDQSFDLIQQGLFLILLCAILCLEIVKIYGGPLKNQLWLHFDEYHVPLFHFVLGALLSAYTIFYFKSSSGILSSFFVILILALLVLNELPAFTRYGLRLRSALTSLALISYFNYLIPTLIKSIGWLAFSLAMLISVGVVFLSSLFFKKHQIETKKILKPYYLPVNLTLGLFFIFYLLAIIPPVPISIKNIGIYHSIEIKDGQYIAGYTRSPWFFWQKGDQDFLALSGDTLNLFASIFSPTEFSDTIKTNWFLYQNRSWVLQDSIPMTIKGGRDLGFRGIARKSHYQPGEWKIEILTSDDREIGSIKFEVIGLPDHFNNRKFHYDYF